MSGRSKEMRNLEFDGAAAVGDLERGRLIIVEGHVVDVRPDPGDPQRVRLVIVPALGVPPEEDRPDQREIEVSCPRDMRLATLRPENFELAPRPGGSAHPDRVA